MKVLILAGGLGTRLKSEVPNLPKPMAPILNRPFLEWLFDTWIEKKATAFYLSIGHLADKIIEYFGSSYKNCPIHYCEEKEPLGTGGGLLYALHQFESFDKGFIVNGDTYFDISSEEMIHFHQKNKAFMTMALRQVEKNERYSGIRLSENRRLIEMTERDEYSKELIINGGAYYIEQSAINQLKSFEIKKCSLEDDLFPKLIASYPIYGCLQKGKFIDIGIPKDYQRAADFFSQPTHKICK